MHTDVVFVGQRGLETAVHLESRWGAKESHAFLAWSRASASCGTDCHSNASLLKFGPKNKN